MSEAPNDPSPPAEDDLEALRLPLIDLESTASPSSPRTRAAQISLVVLALVVASAVLWNSFGPDRRPSPQPSAPLTKISALLVSNVTNATVTVNGKKLAGPLPTVVSAYLETDEVTVTAPLFRPHACQFKGLLTKTDTVHCLFTIRSASNGPSYVIGVFLTPNDLLPAQQNQVIGPITQQLAATRQTTAQPGDYIATSFTNAADFITSQHAAAPLQANVTFVQGPTRAASAFPYTSTCALLICPLGFGPANPEPSEQAWYVQLNIMPRWQFTDSSGHIIADVSYPQSPSSNFGVALPGVQFVYDATGWHMAAGTDLNAEVQSVLCSSGRGMLQQHLLTPSSGLREMAISSDRGVQGCLISVQTDAGGNGTFLWRFGVLLAANAGAHSLLPDLPIAPQAELTAASR